MSVYESKDGGFWIGNNGNGLDYLQDGKVRHYGAEDGLANGHVWSVIQDHQGTLWVGTWGGLYKREQGRFVGLSDGTTISWEVLGMYEDSEGGLWLGQQAVGALTRLQDGKSTIVNIPGASADLDVRVIAEDHDGGLWIGTSDEGLYRRKGGQWTRFGEKEGLRSNAIWSLHVDREDVVGGHESGGIEPMAGGQVHHLDDQGRIGEQCDLPDLGR